MSEINLISELIPIDLTLYAVYIRFFKWDQRCTYLSQRLKNLNEYLFKYIFLGIQCSINLKGHQVSFLTMCFTISIVKTELDFSPPPHSPIYIEYHCDHTFKWIDSQMHKSQRPLLLISTFFLIWTNSRRNYRRRMLELFDSCPKLVPGSTLPTGLRE